MEMFVCTQYRSPVTLMKRACVERQQRAQEAVDETGRHVRYLPMSFDKCIDCEQGRKIMEENQEHVGAMEEKWEVGSVKGEMQEEASSPLQTSPLTLHPSFRTCNKCGETKPETEYYRSGSRYLERICKACKMTRSRENRAKKKTVGANLVFARNAKQTARKTKTDMPSNATGLMGDDGRTQDGQSQGRTQGSPLQRQVGGDHYKTFVIQPIEFITRNGLTFTQGNVVKRICRYNKPGGKGHQDLLKIIHELEILMEMEA